MKQYALTTIIVIAFTLLSTQCSSPTPEPTIRSTEPPPLKVSSIPTNTAFPTAAISLTETQEEIVEPTSEEVLAEPAVLPDGETLVTERCVVCHGLDKIQTESKNPEEWMATVQRMVEKGADLTEVEQDIVITYLSEFYGLEPGSETDVTTGKTLLDSRCTQCHDLGRVQSAQKSYNGWEATVDRMVNKGVSLTSEERVLLIEYLVATYPE